jgi:hypothetical protein
MADLKETTTSEHSESVDPEPLNISDRFISADGEIRQFSTSAEDFLSTYNANYRQRYLELEELLEYAVEMGKLTPNVALDEIKGLKKLLFYTPAGEIDADTLCHAEAQLEWHYNQIALLVSPVTSETLRATSKNYPIIRHSKVEAYFLGDSSIASNNFRQMLWIAIFLVGLMFYFRTFSSQNTLHYIEPFLFGAIGSLIYLYKVLNECHTRRTFDPSKITTDRLRLFMGALSGGLVVNLFYDPNLAGVNASHVTNTTDTAFSSAAFAFLAGYSVDFFYGTLDRLIRNLLPAQETNSDKTVSLVLSEQKMNIPKPATVAPAKPNKTLDDD